MMIVAQFYECTKTTEFYILKTEFYMQIPVKFKIKENEKFMTN